MSKRQLIAFLIGALYSRAALNERTFINQGLVITFPCTKAWIAPKLKEIFGGSVFRKDLMRTRSVCYSLRAKAGLEKFKKVVTPYLHEFPDLKPLVRLLQDSSDNAKQRLRGLSARPRRRRKVIEQSNETDCLEQPAPVLLN